MKHSQEPQLKKAFVDTGGIDINALMDEFSRRGAVVKGVEHIFDNCVSQHLSGAGSSPAGSVGRDLNLQKLNLQYLTTSVAVVLVAR